MPRMIAPIMPFQSFGCVPPQAFPRGNREKRCSVYRFLVKRAQGNALRRDHERSEPTMSSTSELHSPTALPRGTWKGTFKRTLTEFKEDKLNHWGAALTYYAVLSLFPALLVLVSLVGLFANPERVTTVLTDTV